MTNGNNDVRELEDLLTELEGQGALPVGAYSEEEDAVTQLMDAPLGEQEWMVQITPVDRRMMSTDQLITELGAGHLVTRDMLVWRSGMNDWTPISRVDELRVPVSDQTLASVPDRRPVVLAPLPPPAPVPPPRVPSSAVSSPSALGRAPLPPPPSTPFGAAKPLGSVPDLAPPVNGSLSPSFGSPSASAGFVSAFGSPSASSPSASAPFGSPSGGAGFGSPSASAAFSPPPPAPVPGGLLPDLDSAFNIPPAAAVPVPPPATVRVNTQRPVAVDFSEMEPSRPAPLRVLVGSGIAAALMIAGTVYGLSAGGVFETTPAAPVAAAAAPSKPPSPPAAAEAIAPKPAEPSAPAASAEAQTQPASVKEGEPPAPPAAEASEKMAAEGKAAEQKAASEAKLAEAEKAAASKPEPEKAEKVAAKGEDSDDAPKAKAQASSDDDSSSVSAERPSRRSKAARTKKASSEEKASAPAPRRAKPRAAAVASAGAAQEAGDSPKELPGSTFNRDAAKTALDDAAAQARNCRPAGGPSGAGRVQVRYEPNGKVGAVSILTPQFDNTTTGDCVVMVFRRANIPAFTGSPAVVMNKNFEIP